MKSLLKVVLIAFTSALVGGIVVVTGLKLNESSQNKSELIYDDIFRKQSDIAKHFDTLFDEDFFSHHDPFEEMRKMRDQMEKRKNSLRGNPFDSWFSDRFGGGTINDISQREDRDYVYYDIKVEDLNETSINTKIENGYITITGTVEKSPSQQSIFKSTFNRTFPLPENIDSEKMQMIPEKDKIILKFPKRQA